MKLIAAPFNEGLLPTPEANDFAVLRARPSDAMRAGDYKAEQGHKPMHDRLEAQGFDVQPRLSGEFGAVGVALTRDRAENRANIARAFGMTRAGGYVLFAGAKTDGVQSLQKEMRKLLPEAGVMPRNHGRVIWFERPDDLPAIFDEWIETAKIAPRADGMHTGAGMFSWKEPDEGSALLAEHLPEKLAGVVGDFGAGWGWLSHKILAREKVTRLDMIEADHEAIECAKLNITDERARPMWADVTSVPARRGYDWVITNPPFHEGRDVAVSLGVSFLQTASKTLKPTGKLLLVANVTLAYETPLAGMFGKVEEIARNRRFKVILASRPKGR